MSTWQQWLQHPERVWVRNALFQVHFLIGAAVSLYVFVMSVSGSVLVYRNQLSTIFSLGWLVNLHANLLFGMTGRLVNGVGSVCLTLLCCTGIVIWWPGVKNWQRSLGVNWSAHLARISWDLHSALGFWCFFPVLVWGISGAYFSFPHVFDRLLLFDPEDRFTDQGLFWMSQLHFGRFGWFTELLWCGIALVPAILSFTGLFICCRRIIYNKPANPNLQSH
jgi:uncharacterized iron-regulated membrane protein